MTRSLSITSVEILPQWDLGTKEFKLGHKKGTELIMRLQDVVRPDLFNPKGVFDGKKNLFSFKQYAFNSEEFSVPWDPARRSNKPRTVAIRIVFVKKIHVGSIGHLINGDRESLKPDSDASMTLTMLNLFIQSAPRMTEPMIHNAKSFFTPKDKRTGDRIRPLELWRGHFQSVRPAHGKIVVNIDTTIGVILPRLHLEQICCEFLRVRSIRDQAVINNLGKLRTFLKGVRVEVDLAGHQGKRSKSIKDVVQNVGAITFDKKGETVSVADHFQRAHGVNIRPGSLGVKLGTDGVFPISVCRSIQQLYKNRSSPDVVREALEFTPRDPSQRLSTIMAGWQDLCFDTSDFLIGAGIKVIKEPLRINGRILPTPEIGFGNNSKIKLQRFGQWDVMRKSFVQPRPLHNWVVVDLAGCDPSVLSTFIRDLVQAMTEKENAAVCIGMDVHEPHNVIRNPPTGDIPRMLTDAGRAAKAQMILVILPESALEPYRRVKRFGDITQGVVTQCVKWSRKLAGDAQNRRANQYHNNLILKINVKLGGVNWVPLDNAMNFLKSEPTMVIGADVSHPGPGSHLPSVSGLVASMDPTLSRYAGCVKVQDSRTEMIADLPEMFENLLKMFYRLNKVTPRRIFIFRDGVSEGEFQTVLDKELADINGVLVQAYGSNLPHVNFIIVGKRHHFRFFPMDPQSADPKGNGNLHAGFTVDQDIVHPVHRDFYLQSQPGLKGTSRPSHYTVLRNESNLNPDQLQQIAYALCHCYSRSTRSVKIPAPVYYADLVCRRAKFHFDENIGDIDTQSISSSGSDQHHTDFYRAHFDPINAALSDKMYFV